MIVYRLADPRFDGKPGEAMDGTGGLFGPARWHPKGHRIVYLASSVALCTLEMKVQDSGIKPAYAGFEVEIPDHVSRRTLDRARLPANWRDRASYPQCQALGLEWLTGKDEPALLLVPSAVVPLETNILLNPAHADAVHVKTTALGLLATDVRLLELSRRERALQDMDGLRANLPMPSVDVIREVRMDRNRAPHG